jgi:hypothetical protein
MTTAAAGITTSAGSIESGTRATEQSQNTGIRHGMHPVHTIDGTTSSAGTVVTPLDIHAGDLIRTGGDNPLHLPRTDGHHTQPSPSPIIQHEVRIIPGDATDTVGIIETGTLVSNRRRIRPLRKTDPVIEVSLILETPPEDKSGLIKAELTSGIPVHTPDDTPTGAKTDPDTKASLTTSEAIETSQIELKPDEVMPSETDVTTTTAETQTEPTATDDAVMVHTYTLASEEVLTGVPKEVQTGIAVSPKTEATEAGTVNGAELGIVKTVFDSSGNR